MLSEWYMRRRYRQGYAEGYAQGLALVRAEAEGLARGHADRQRMWEAWNNLRLAAEAQGLPFDEPPPSPPNGHGG